MRVTGIDVAEGTREQSQQASARRQYSKQLTLMPATSSSA
jgi:hypothetical protein